MFDSKRKKYVRYWRLLQNAPEMHNARDAARVEQHIRDVMRASQAESLSNAHRAQLHAEANRVWRQRHLNMQRRGRPRPPNTYRPARNRRNQAANQLVHQAYAEVQANRRRKQAQNAEMANMRRRFEALKHG